MKRHSSSTPSPPSLAPCGAFVAVLACAACAGAPAAERSAPAFSEAEWSALPVPHPTLRPGAVRLSAAEMELLGTPERPATPAVSARLGLTELVSSGVLRRSDVQLVEPPLARGAATHEVRIVDAETGGVV